MQDCTPAGSYCTLPSPPALTGRRKPMLANDPTVTELHTLYCDEMLARMKGGPKLSNLRNMYDVARASAPVVVQADAVRTWVWSDLHLNHDEIIHQCGRPFTTGEEMNEALLHRWRLHVRRGDTIVNGGDAAWPGTLGTAFRARVGRLPGRKVLVVGNHDFHHRTKLLDAAAHDVVTGLAVFDTDPPLALTHLPLRNPPPGWVNLHGHLHHKPSAGHPYINVCVEHTDYRPMGLADLETLAKHQAAGRFPVGDTTIEQIARIKNLDASAPTRGTGAEGSAAAPPEPGPRPRQER